MAGEDGTDGDATAAAAQVTVDVPGREARASGAEPPPRPAGARYQDRGEIGRGGMGSVRRTYDAALRRVVALKRMLPDLPEEVARRFFEEAQVTGQLEHPNIVPVYDLALEPGAGFFTMKLLSGKTLTHAITELHAEGMADALLERILRILVAVCDAVSFAHSRGVVHRDLKPANIMVGSHGQVYVMDWGAALLLGRDGSPPSGMGTAPGDVLGTVHYMAPEQARGMPAAIDARTDVFALGAVLYEVLTGWPPYAGVEPEELLELARRAEIVPPREACPGQRMPEGLAAIAMKALAADPGRRYPSADALRQDLERLLRGGGWLATRTFGEGQLIVRQGEEGDAGYVVVSGSCEVSQERGGREHVLRRLGPGDVFGETSILGAQPRTASVRALEAVTVKVITAEALERELSLNTWVGAFVKQLTARFVEVEERLRRAEGLDRGV